MGVTRLVKAWNDDHACSQDIWKVLEKHQDNPGLCGRLWNAWEGEPDAFKTKRRSIWPDWEFYDESFIRHRAIIVLYMLAASHDRAMKLHESHETTVLQIISTLICPQDEESTGDLLALLGRGFLSNIFIFGRMVFSRYEKGTICSSAPWKTFYERLLRLLVAEMDVAHLSQNEFEEHHDILFTFSPLAPSRAFLRSRPEQRITPSRIPSWLNYQLAVYVNILSASGIDINGFGHYFQSRIISTSPYRRFSSLHEPEYRFIALEFGPRPDDWKVWINTDMMEVQYAGDFWRLVDSQANYETGRMPGAWVE